MTDRKLAILGVVAVLMAGWAVIQGRLSQNYQPDRIVISPLIGGLDIESVQAIRVTSDKGAKTVDLKRQGGMFVIDQKDGYPADSKKVNDLISGCLDLRVSSGDKITSNADNHADLGVTPETARCRVEFLDAEGKPIVGMLVSEADAESNIAYTRLTTAGDVYKADDIPMLSTSASEFLDTMLFEVSQDEITRVTVTDPNGGAYTLVRPDAEGGEIQLEAMPAGMQFEASTYRSVFNGLSYFRFEDVQSEQAAGARQFPWQYQAETKDSVVYTLHVAPGETDNFLKASAEYTGPEPSVQKQVESEEQLKEREARFLAKEKAEKFNRQHRGWVYRIPSYKAKDLTHGRDDLIEPVPAPAAEAPAPPAVPEVQS